MKLVEEWKKELPCQFQGKGNLSAIIDAVGKQITGLEAVFADLKEKTDIRYAAGKNLDMIGDIVGITRLEAYKLLEIMDIDALDDEAYRNVLYFQILKNNSYGTYEDIMKGLHLLWGNESIITYEENPITAIYNGEPWGKAGPASLRIDIKDIPSDIPDPTVIKPMVIRPGGVKMFFETNYRDRIELKPWEHFRNLQITCDIYNRYTGLFKYDGTIRYAAQKKDVYILHNGRIQYNGRYYQSLHDMVVKLIKYAADDGTGMTAEEQSIYEFLRDREMDKYSKAKEWQDMYKEM